MLDTPYTHPSSIGAVEAGSGHIGKVRWGLPPSEMRSQELGWKRDGLCGALHFGTAAVSGGAPLGLVLSPLKNKVGTLWERKNLLVFLKPHPDEMMRNSTFKRDHILLFAEKMLKESAT